MITRSCAMLYIFTIRVIISRIYAVIIYSGTNGQKLEMPFQVLVCFVMSIIDLLIWSQGPKRRFSKKKVSQDIHPIYVLYIST